VSKNIGPEEFDETECTAWFPASERPVRIGWFEVEAHSFRPRWLYWGGSQWSWHHRSNGQLRSVEDLARAILPRWGLWRGLQAPANPRPPEPQVFVSAAEE